MPEAIEIPPEDCVHYENAEDVPEDIRKYWFQRYDIFSKWDEDIWMTNESWFGVTPEPIAHTIADHITSSMPPGKSILIDAFAGVGGNTIAFALSGKFNQIFAFENDPATLKCAKHNAAIYGVKNILWAEGDCFELMKKKFGSDPKMKDKAVIFASPPWGGVDYNKDPIFDLTTMPPYGLQTLWDAFTKITKEVVLYLPRTADLNQLAQLVGMEGEELKDEDRVQVTHYCMRGASKALCVYYGKFTG